MFNDLTSNLNNFYYSHTMKSFGLLIDFSHSTCYNYGVYLLGSIPDMIYVVFIISITQSLGQNLSN